MRNFQQKRGWRSVMESKPIIIILGIFVLIFAWAVLRFMLKMQQTRENRMIAESKVAQLEKEKEKLSTDIAKLKTNEGVEESIREKFGFAKEGEGLIVIVDDKSSQNEKKDTEKGFFSFFKNWFRD